MLDSVTSRPECCYSALSSAETARPMLRLPKAPPHPNPAWGPTGWKKNTPLSPSTTTSSRTCANRHTQTHTPTRTSAQVLPFFTTPAVRTASSCSLNSRSLFLASPFAFILSCWVNCTWIVAENIMLWDFDIFSLLLTCLTWQQEAPFLPLPLPSR